MEEVLGFALGTEQAVEEALDVLAVAIEEGDRGHARAPGFAQLVDQLGVGRADSRTAAHTARVALAGAQLADDAVPRGISFAALAFPLGLSHRRQDGLPQCLEPSAVVQKTARGGHSGVAAGPHGRQRARPSAGDGVSGPVAAAEV